LHTFITNSLLLATLLLTTSCTSLVRPNFTQELVKLRAGQYQLDKQHSFLIFRIGHLELSKIVGRFNTFDATLDFDPQTLQESDWFNTTQFPQLVFNSSSVSVTDNNKFLINGELTMRGVTQPATVTATFNGGADNLLTRKYTIGFSANATLKRSDFGMDTFSAFIGDTIEVELHAEFQRQ